MGLTVLPIYLVLKMYTQLGIAAAVIAITSFILKKTWWDNLDAMDEETSASAARKKDLVTILE